LSSSDPFDDIPPNIVGVATNDAIDQEKANHGTMSFKDVGALLCSTRMRKEIDLREVSDLLRIRYSYLIAIEDGRLEDLPGNTYSYGFIRSYADYLGLDGGKIIGTINNNSSSVEKDNEYDFSLPERHSGLPSGSFIFISICAGIFFYVFWFTFFYSERSAIDIIQDIPDRLSSSLSSDSDFENGNGNMATSPEIVKNNNTLDAPNQKTSLEEFTSSTLSQNFKDDSLEKEDIQEVKNKQQEDTSNSNLNDLISKDKEPEKSDRNTSDANEDANKPTQTSNLERVFYKLLIPDNMVKNKDIEKIEIQAIRKTYLRVMNGPDLVSEKALGVEELYELPLNDDLSLMVTDNDSISFFINGNLINTKNDE